ncbi:c-type cytochrome [Deinococcus knuensis]|uniref:Cytochrome c domain-containing protein n=1 Tax=Deinococcus knuensis TaxID=1837380 RepID=A0ABQ2SKJ9_9DEIO|nr:cytochrome c [Deinococcus knuensis]GGS30198.1 hypothetical protein GCM10008961_22350 [Deinococcus knuensis]
MNGPDLTPDFTPDPSERGFTVREIGAFVLFVTATVSLGVWGYRTGQGLAGTGGATVTAVHATVPDGQTLFAGNCAGCHGAQGQGGLGPALKAPAAWAAPDFQRAVMQGVTPDGRTLGAVMPRIAQVGLDGQDATPEQLAALQEYLKTLP